MSGTCIIRESSVERTARVMQMEGLFDVPPSQKSTVTLNVNLPILEKECAREWNVGLIVGPSGTGKSTVARELFGEHLVSEFEWPGKQSIVDGFPSKMSIKDITALLSSVGFSSPPAWVRPYHVLSTGEQFRVNVARALAEKSKLAVLDEFTSVVDRTVAQVGSCAVAKTVRRRKQQLIAVSCHYDIIDWLQPDWIYQPGVDDFQWRFLQQRPDITINICRVHRKAWELFRQHHYLDTSIAKAAACFMGSVENRPAVFSAAMSFPHPTRPGWREHRTVCLPDFQGVGIGNAMSAYVASLYASTGKPYRSTTSHPAMIMHRAKSRIWKLSRKVGRTSVPSKRALIQRTACRRLTASFEYCGESRAHEARQCGIKGVR